MKHIISTIAILGAAFILGACTSAKNSGIYVLSWVEEAKDASNMTKTADLDADVKANTAVGAEASTGAETSNTTQEAKE